MWYLATYDQKPSAVPVAFKDVTDDGKLLVGGVFLETTLVNIKKNGKLPSLPVTGLLWRDTRSRAPPGMSLRVPAGLFHGAVLVGQVDVTEGVVTLYVPVAGGFAPL